MKAVILKLLRVSRCLILALRKRNYPSVLAIISLLAVTQLNHLLLLEISADKHDARQGIIRQAKLSETVSMYASGRGYPRIGLSDGHDLITAYSGPDDLRQALEENQAQPLSLASADYDEDGVLDLVCGFAHQGRGIITIHRGNVDSIYPNAAEARQRKSEGTFTYSPFLSPARVFVVAESANFLASGDFDGDNHRDVVTAAQNGNKLFLLSGDGKGGLGEAKGVSLPGRVTAMTVGEINRRDGLDDLAVAITEANGSKVLVFEGAEGALRAKPESFNLPSKATSLALGQLDDEYTYDLAIGVRGQLMILHGRDRRLSLDEARQAEVKPAIISGRSFPSAIQSIAVGDFTGGHNTDIALLFEDRTGILLNGDVPTGKKKKPSLGIGEWPSKVLAHGLWSEAAQLVCVDVSSAPVDDLAVVDSQSNHLDLLTDNSEGSGRVSTKAGTGSLYDGISASFGIQSELKAVLPMRLNADALSDLVILRNGQSGPTVVMTQAVMTFTVTNTNDSGAGSLREAIHNANANPGADTITFNIASSGVPRISPQSPLPTVTDAVTIDGTSQPGGQVELDGSNVAPAPVRDGLEITAGNSVVQGLVINSFFDAGIRLATNGANVVAGNFIGTNVAGTVAKGNLFGVVIDNVPDNVIGGTATAARNVISANEVLSIGIVGSAATGNHVEGNYIGTDSSGTATFRIGTNSDRCGSGVDVRASGNTIGGVTAGVRNIISGNPLGIIIATHADFIENPAGNLVQGNYIGTDFSGTASLRVRLGSNCDITLSSGVIIGAARDNTIGGTTAAARNIISGNSQNGITIEGFGPDRASPGNLVQGNYIGTDLSGTLALGNLKDGVDITNALDNTIGGATPEARNIISGNGGHGVAIGIRIIDPLTGREITGGTGISVQGNFIGTEVNGAARLGNGLCGVFVDADSVENTIEGNIIAFNGTGGVCIPNNDNPGVRIKILSNSIYSNDGLGIDLGDPGITPNDPLDLDLGANEQQNSPELTSVTLSDAGTTNMKALAAADTIQVGVSFNSTPNSTFTIQFFFSSSCPSESPQSVTLLPILVGNKEVTTDNNGNASFTFSFELPSGVSGGFVNATATRFDGNTSEFSRCFGVGVLISIPRITSVTRSGKKLFVSGENFDNGAKILINGTDQKTKFESANRLIGKKAGKKVRSGDKLQVRNSDGTVSPEFTYNP